MKLAQSGRDGESDVLNTCLTSFRTTMTDHTGGEIRGKVRRGVVGEGLV